MEPKKSFLSSKFSFLLIFFLITISLCGLNASSEEQNVKSHKGPVVKRDQRRTLVDTEYGEISATDVKEGQNKTPNYHIQFFTLEPNSVFLPVLLHAAMVFYVHTGSGKLSWANEDGTSTIDIHEGDVASLKEGSVFYIHSNLEPQRKKLRIYAIFTNRDDSTFDPSIGAYSRINELVKGFDEKIIQAAFKVPEDLIEAITNKTETPAIVHAVPEKKHNNVLELEASLLEYFTGIESNSKKLKTYNIFDNDPDFKNCYGWTSTVTKKQLKRLKSHNIGVFMVNLTRGSMLGPHWNPLATEVAVVLEGKGMVRVVCGSNTDDECKNQRFRVKQGDVFVVSRFHPMAQISFDNEPLVFMGFSTAAKKNYPQFLAGEGSVLQILDRQIVATSLGVNKTTIDKLLENPDDSIIFECSSCAEEEEKLMEEEKEKEREEEEKRKREEEEEDEKRREKEEEEEKERERKEKEEEEVRRREEERKREEEEARRQQEERERRRKEEEAREEARRQEEERERKREEEEARREREEIRRRRKEKEREEEAEREEEEARRQQEKRERKEEEARREKEREKEEARREMEEEARKQQEKWERREEEAKREIERKKRRKEEIEREKERKREEAESEEEAAERQQEKRERKEEEARREKEREEEEEEAIREMEEEARKQEKRERKEEEAKREIEREKRRQEEKERKREEAESEEEAARKQQEKRE
ncbi:vicilin-like protein antimicrobial peptides 2-2-like protein, partial [Trifolium pratense]